MDKTNELAKAFMCAYVALVNRLDASNAVSKPELITVLSGFSEMLSESPENQGASQYLTAFVASLSGDAGAADAALKTLH